MLLGWQPGIQEDAADWDEDWDKFNDAGMFIWQLNVDMFYLLTIYNGFIVKFIRSAHDASFGRLGLVASI